MIEALIQATGLCQLIIDKKGRVLFIGDNSSKALSIRIENSPFIYECCPELSMKDWRNLCDQLIGTKSLSKSMEFIDADGRIFDAKCLFSVSDQNDEVQLIFNKEGAADQVTEIISTSISQIDEMIYWVRPDSSFVYVNDAAPRKLGYTHEELLEMTVSDIDPSLTQEAYTKFFANLKTQKYTEVESQNITKSGKVIHVIASSTYVHYRDMEFACVIIKDVSKMKKAQTVIEEMKFAMDNASVICLWNDLEGNIVYVNQAAEKKYGYKKEELLSMHVSQLNKSMDVKKLDKIIKEIEGESEWNMETVHTTKEGLTFPVHIYASRLTSPNRVINVLFINDITVKKKTLARLEEMQFAMDNVNKTSIWSDLDGNIVYVNQAAVRKYGYTKEEFLQLHYLKLSPHSSIEELQEYSSQIGVEDDWSIESEHQKKDGSLFPVEVAASCLDVGTRDLNIFFITDITSRVQRRIKREELKEEIVKLKDKLQEENEYLMEEIADRASFQNIISVDESYKEVLTQVQQVAGTDSTVLITGETGTGKELLARAVHQISSRSHRSLIRINCSTLPKDLIESELFGHRRGAFTGAFEDKKGRFELADGGTIFLDEIGELPLELQPKLLRVLQEGEFEKLGDPETRVVDVRVIAATNRNLEEEIAQKRFRQDLYYRLNVFPIHNIPLRERINDVPLLAQHFTSKFSKKIGKSELKITKRTIQALKDYQFPGNVRELENIIERSVILSRSTTLKIDQSLLNNTKSIKGKKNFESFDEAQRSHIISALEKSRWKVTGKNSASELLGINGKTLASKMRKFGISRDSDYI